MSSPRFLFISSPDPEKVSEFNGKLSRLDLHSWRPMIPSPPFLHPILDAEELLWVRGQPLETVETGLWRNNRPFLVEIKDSRDNASYPPVTRLVLQGMILDGDAFFDDHGSLLEDGPVDEDEWEKTEEYSANGTGPGGVLTVLDVVKAVVNVTNRYPQCESVINGERKSHLHYTFRNLRCPLLSPFITDHDDHFDCFAGIDEAFINRQGQLVITKVNWHS